jgi:hypothetical protein
MLVSAVSLGLEMTMVRHAEAEVGTVRHRVAAIALEEFKKVLPPTIFFAIGFNLIVLTQRILLADYLMHFAGFLVATTTALVVGKAVLVAELAPLLKRYDNARPIFTILFKTIVYWACVFVARLVEAYVHYIIDEGRIIGFFPYLIEHISWHRFLFIQIWIFVLFLLYTTGVEIDQRLGDGGLRKALLHRHPTRW